MGEERKSLSIPTEELMNLHYKLLINSSLQRLENWILRYLQILNVVEDLRLQTERWASLEFTQDYAPHPQSVRDNKWNLTPQKVLKGWRELLQECRAA